MFDGAYVVDNYSLVLKGLFLLSGYVDRADLAPTT